MVSAWEQCQRRPHNSMLAISRRSGKDPKAMPWIYEI